MSMTSNRKVLVVGTTTDYVEWIRRGCPGQALFLTDSLLRYQAAEPVPQPEEEVICNLDDLPAVQEHLGRHLDIWGIVPDGVVCFDCESLELAALLAEEYRLPFPSLQSVSHCRDKQKSKALWRGAKVGCPDSRLVDSEEAAWSLARTKGGACVLKPLSGSGSELVYLCRSEKECGQAVAVIRRELRQRRDSSAPLYRGNSLFLAEEWIDGDEYSCDFQIADGQVRVIRLTAKVTRSRAPFGTVLAYVLLSPDDLPHSCRAGRLERTLLAGASALGLERAICMVDFLVNDEGIFLLEMTPRPGGDCIPHLLKSGCGYDILAQSLRFARRQPVSPLPENKNGYPVGMRLHGNREGVIKNFDISALAREDGVFEVSLKRKPGERIILPPADYDSWHLGHVLFRTGSRRRVEEDCRRLRSLIGLEIG